MNKNEIAKNKLRKMSIKRLVELFESTTTNNDKNIYMVRGWLLDIIEEKNPIGVENWLDTEMALDEDLRKYVLA